MNRKDHEESCKCISEYISHDIHKLPPSRPNYDDEERGVSFYKTLIQDKNLDC